MKIKYLIFSFLLFSEHSFSQEYSQLLKDAANYTSNGENDKAEKSIQDFINQSSKTNNSLYLVQGYAVRSRLYSIGEKYKEAAEYSNKAFEIANKSNNPIEKAYATMSKCWLDFYMNNHRYIIQDAKKAIAIAHNTKQLYLEFYLNLVIYNVYSQLDKMDLCIQYVNDNLKIGKILNDPSLICLAEFQYSNILRRRYGQAPKNKVLRDSISMLYKHIINEYHEGKGLLPTFLSTLVNETNFVVQNNKLDKNEILKFLKNRTDTLREYLNKVKISKELFVSIVYNQMAEAQNIQGQIDSTIYYLKLANSVLPTTNLIYQNTKMQGLNSLVSLYLEKKDYKNAYLAESEKNTTSKAFFDKEMENLNRKIEAQFDLESKRVEISSLKAKEEFQSKLNYLYWGLIAMGAFAFYGVIKSYQFKLKFSKERTQNLKLEKEEAELQNKLSKEEQARLESEQNLLHVQQEQMKRELMLNMLHLEHKNLILKNLQEKMNDGSTINLQRIIKEENNIDLDFEEVKTQIQDIHPAFFSILSEKSQQKLTNLDVKYCAYLHLGLDTKQIAQLLNVEPKSVRMSKYRIKQKLGLDKDLDLENYLKEVI